MVERLKKVGLSCFVVLNLLTVLFMNRPAPVMQGEDKVIETLDEGLAYKVRYARWLVERYAFCTGLNNQWRMFGDPSRYYMWYIIKGKYGDGDPLPLPLPLQSERTFWQSALFDFKETKFHHTLYTRPAAREAYAHYLARQFPVRDGVPISSIIFELNWQEILPREEASKAGNNLDPHITAQVVQTVTFGQP